MSNIQFSSCVSISYVAYFPHRNLIQTECSMANDQETTISAEAVSAAPVVDAAPITTNSVPDISAPVAEPVAAPVEPAVTEPAKTETPTPPVSESVLGDEPVKEVAKPDTKSEGDKKTDTKVETAKEEVKADLPVYEPFKLPENVQLDKEPLDAFTKILGEIETGKLDHLGMQEKGQALIDLAAKNTVDSINRLNDYYVQIHETQKKDWFESFKKDPDLGGSEERVMETTVRLRESIDNFGGTEAQKSEFRTLMKDTGVGNNPALLRILNNMQKKIDSYTKETGGRSVPAQAPAPSKVKDYQRFYQSN